MTLHVTDHAVIRYMELVLGFDVDQVRNRIRNVCADAARAGASAVAHEGFLYKFAPGGTHVVTITPDKPRTETGGRHPTKRARR